MSRGRASTGGSQSLDILQLYPKSDVHTGAAIQLRDLAVGLARRGHRVTVGTPPSRVWAEYLAGAGLRHAEIPMRRPWDPRAAWRLARLVRRHEIQIVHAHKGRARTLVLLAGIFGARPRLVLNRGVSFPLGPVNRLGYTTRRVDAVVAVCQSIRRGLVASGVPAEKIEVIYSATDTERFHPGVDARPIRRELGLGPEHALVTQIGVRSWRGWRDVLEAMVRIAGAADRARLLFVGAPGPRIAEVNDLARERGIGDRVLVLPPRDDIPAILAASDVVVDGSYLGLGITGSIREALACERPVVATEAEGMPELVVHGETGLLVPPRAPAALADAVLTLLADPTRAGALARAGRKRVEAHFSLGARLEATEALYRRLLAAPGAS